MYRERLYDEGYEMPGRTNPVYKARLQKNPLADTPLFEAIGDEQKPTPPKTIRPSKARMEAFGRLLPKIEKRQQQVLAVIKGHGPITVHNIATHLHWQDHLVSGRVTELRNGGWIEERGFEINPETNRKNSLWRAK